MVFTTFWAVFITTAFSFFGFILFIIGYFGGNFKIVEQEQCEIFQKQYEMLYEESVINQQETSWMRDIPAFMGTFYSAIDITVRDLFSTLMIISIIIWASVMLLIMSWLTPSNTFVGFFLCSLCGAFVAGIVTYFTLVITIGTVFRFPINSGDSRESAIRHSYGNGFFLGLFMVSCIMIFLLLQVMLVYLLDNMTGQMLTFSQLSVIFSGFPFGFILCSFIFRECISITSRGVSIATDLVIRNDRFLAEMGNLISYTSKVVTVVSSLIANNVINYLDSAALIVLVLTAPFVTQFHHIIYQLIMIHTITGDEVEWGILLSPTALLSLNMVGAVIASFFSSSFQDSATSAFTAKNIRMQVLIQSIFSVIILAIFVNFVVLLAPEQFTFGTPDQNLKYIDDMSPGRLVVCSLMGLWVSIIMLITMEIFTSHGFGGVRDLSRAADNAPTLNVITAYYLGSFQQFIILFLLGIFMMICFEWCGLPGLLYGLIGFIMNIMILMPILFLAGTSHEGARCATIAQVAITIIERIHKIAWAARNYSIYLKIVNAIGTVMIGFLLVGLSTFKSSDDSVLQTSSYSLFGSILGLSLVFINRSLNLQAVKIVIEESLLGERLMQNQRGSENEDDAMNNYDRGFFVQQLKMALPLLIINLVLTTFIVIMNGIIFGPRGALSLALSYLLLSMVLLVVSLITGGALKNSRLYNQCNKLNHYQTHTVDPRFNQSSQIFASHLYGDIQGMAIEESQSVPFLVHLIYILLLTFIGIQLFQDTAYAIPT